MTTVRTRRDSGFRRDDDGAGRGRFRLSPEWRAEWREGCDLAGPPVDDGSSTAMLQFAANLTMLFNELPTTSRQALAVIEAVDAPNLKLHSDHSALVKAIERLANRGLST